MRCARRSDATADGLRASVPTTWPQSRCAQSCERTGVAPTAIDDVYFGAANQSGEDNRNVARMAVLLAGLPVEVPGATVNRLCGSSLQAINSAAQAIAFGDVRRRRRRRSRIDDARAVRLAEERGTIRSQTTALRYGPGMAHGQSKDAGRVDDLAGRDRREGCRALRNLARRARPLCLRVTDEVQGGDRTRRFRRGDRQRCRFRRARERDECCCRRTSPAADDARGAGEARADFQKRWNGNCR